MTVAFDKLTVDEVEPDGFSVDIEELLSGALRWERLAAIVIENHLCDVGPAGKRPCEQMSPLRRAEDEQSKAGVRNAFRDNA